MHAPGLAPPLGPRSCWSSEGDRIGRPADTQGLTASGRGCCAVRAVTCGRCRRNPEVGGKAAVVRDLSAVRHGARAVRARVAAGRPALRLLDRSRGPCAAPGAELPPPARPTTPAVLSRRCSIAAASRSSSASSGVPSSPRRAASSLDRRRHAPAARSLGPAGRRSRRPCCPPVGAGRPGSVAAPARAIGHERPSRREAGAGLP